MGRKEVSFTAAEIFPIKMFLVPELAEQIRNGYIPPVHPSISPTNRCNKNCPFCSYSEREKQLEMPFEEVCELINVMKDLGMKAVDITGGGESLMHKDIEDIIEYIRAEGIKMGLTTNGMLLPRIESQIRDFVWIRISMSSYDDPTALFNTLGDLVEDNSDVDWNISWVITRNPDYERFADAVRIANYYRMTHFRAVNDLLDLDYLPPIESFKKYLADVQVNDELLIYQDRLAYTHGHRKCLISLLRPNIDARGDVYPCCGTQYATDVPYKNFAPTFNMGRDYESIWGKQRYFDGSFCTKCYYGRYNEVLNTLQSKEVRHIEFV